MKPPLAGFILIATLLASGTDWRTAAQTPAPADIAVPNAPAASQGGPKIQFAGTEHDFGKIDNGAIVKFDFVFTNTGTSTLEVTDVWPSCGCTTPGTWSKSVEPGQSGTIPIQFNSANFSGAIHKTVTVICNTPAQSQTILHLKATVWKAIDVNPSIAYFTPQAGARALETKVVRIVNNADMPLELSPPECANNAFTAELKTLREGKEFEVRISAKPPFGPGTVQGPITLKTSSKNLPVITINGIVMVQLPITALPSQLVLGSTPLAVATRLGVTLRSSGSAAVTVSEPSVNVPGVEATLKELQPGRVFNIMLNFPAGFKIEPTRHVELSVKTSHPQYPIVRVPIVQTSQASRPQPTVGPPQPPAVRQDGAIIQFAQTEHDFGKINNGTSLNFDFVFTNTGTAPLEILAVHSSSAGITAGAWSKSVEPGQTGTIPIRFNSEKLSGVVHKTVAVTCNTPTQARTILHLKATVWRAIDVTPAAVYFTPQADARTVETQLVRIVNNTNVPLELAPPECSNKTFAAELKTLKAGKEFEVRISAKPPFGPGTIQGPITLKTSSKDLPVLTIDGIVMVQLPIMAPQPTPQAPPLPLPQH
jgi:antitoxin component of RelBE/YafQ-DinJ toxin-antitoxin module